MIGKLDPETLARVLGRTGAANANVVAGAAYGEDAAAIDLGETILVVSSDPISLAAEAAGSLGVAVAANDVAASGADPAFLTNVMFLPDDDPETLDTLTAQLDAAATAIGVTIVGGHSEYLPVLSRPLLSLSCFGTTDRFVPTGGVRPGDRIVLTKGAAIEGTAILATDFEQQLQEAGVSAATLDRAASFFEEISVIEDSRAVRDLATAMHDPTEGGVWAGLVELAAASAVELEIERDRIPIRPETKTICSAIGVDPLRIFGSGGLLASIPEAKTDVAIDRLEAVGIDAAIVGEAREPAAGDTGAIRIDGDRRTDPGRDDLYPLWEALEDAS
ncbi:MAG: AIR synthase-related protein [Halobacteriota archaeon]